MRQAVWHCRLENVFRRKFHHRSKGVNLAVLVLEDREEHQRVIVVDEVEVGLGAGEEPGKAVEEISIAEIKIELKNRGSVWFGFNRFGFEC